MTVRALSTVWFLASCLLAASAAARARESTRLVFDRAPSADACPARAAFEDAVATRLGFVPWSDDGERSLLVSFLREEDERLAARIELRDPRGRLLGERALSAAGPGCEELAASVTLVASIALDADHEPLVTDAPASGTALLGPGSRLAPSAWEASWSQAPVGPAPRLRPRVDTVVQVGVEAGFGRDVTRDDFDEVLLWIDDDRFVAGSVLGGIALREPLRLWTRLDAAGGLTSRRDDWSDGDGPQRRPRTAGGGGLAVEWVGRRAAATVGVYAVSSVVRVCDPGVPCGPRQRDDFLLPWLALRVGDESAWHLRAGVMDGRAPAADTAHLTLGYGFARGASVAGGATFGVLGAGLRAQGEVPLGSRLFLSVGAGLTTRAWPVDFETFGVSAHAGVGARL